MFTITNQNIHLETARGWKVALFVDMPFSEEKKRQLVEVLISKHQLYIIGCQVQ